MVIGLYEGSKSKAKAEADGLTVMSNADAAKAADIIMFTLPDPIQGKIYEEDVAPNLEAGNMIMFAHGFNVRYGFVVAPENVDVTMVAPKAPGHRVREVFVEGSGVPGLLAVHQDATGNAKRLHLLTPRALAVRVPAFWKQPSRKRPRPIFSASRPFSVVA